jgi:hypothetical protein
MPTSPSAYGQYCWGPIRNRGRASLIALGPDRLWGTTCFLQNGYRVLFPWVNRSEREAVHSLPCSADVEFYLAVIAQSV